MSGKAFEGVDLKSGELLVWIYKMILTVDRKHLILLFCKSNDRTFLLVQSFFAIN